MDQSTLLTILSIAGSIIVLLLGVVAYFFQRSINAVEELKKAVADLRTYFSSQKTDLANFRQEYNSISRVTENRLNSHAERLDDLDRRVTINTTKLGK